MFKNIIKLCLFDIKVHKKQILSWCIAIFSIMFLYMILFPSVQGMAQVKMDLMPEELLQFVGMDDLSDMSNFVSYFSIIFNIILIAISIFAVTFSSNILAKEEKNKTIEFLYSVEVSRMEIYSSKICCAIIGSLAVGISALISTIICGFINGGETFILMDVVKIVVLDSVTVLLFISFGIMLSGFSSRISGATIGSFFIISLYVIGFLSSLVSEQLSWIRSFSPFEMLDYSNYNNFSMELIVVVAGYLLLSLIFINLGALIYRIRDLNA